MFYYTHAYRGKSTAKCMQTKQARAALRMSFILAKKGLLQYYTHFLNMVVRG